ncbi:MAG TPA: hypothetical protein VK469_09675, partial [Candidatus Kapabacteria bacterium]|nr:hypothetical protein [Candidatus Kapabacteria bacterium]
MMQRIGIELRRKILWIAVILLTVILLAVLLLHTPFVKAKVLHYIQKQLAQTYNLSLSAQSLDYNLLTLRVSLKKFNLKSLDNPAQPPFFQADLAVVQLTTALIFKKKIDLVSFYLEKPVINVHRYPDKSFNIPSQLFKKSGEPPPQLIFRHIIVNNGSLFFYDQTENLQANLQGFHLEGALPEKGRKELILQLPSPAAGTARSLIFKDNTLQVEQAKIITRLDEQTALVTLAGTYLDVNEPFTFAGQVHWEQNRLSVPGFLFTLREGEISGQGVYYSTPGSTPSHLSLNWKNLNLQSPLLTKFFSHPIYSAISGSGDLSFRELSLKSIQANIAAAFQPLKIPPPPGFIHLTGQASLRLDSGKITIPSSDLFAQGDHIQGKLAV